tara:strand:+ start:959 stop:1327 length:369 start_codon:yes stop_codon:yes gene_type:complete
MDIKKIFRFSRGFDNKDEIILRDYLAMERTTLANERTLLSYIRSSLYLLVGGIALLKLENFENLHFLGYLSLILTVCFVVIGLYRYQKLKSRLKVYYEEIESFRKKHAQQKRDELKNQKLEE